MASNPTASGKAVTKAAGESTPLKSLFVYSDPDNDIVRFAVKDRDLGGGYLTKNGVKQTETALFDNIPIGEIGQWAFVAGPAGSTSTIGFNAINSRGAFNPSVTSTVSVPAAVPHDPTASGKSVTKAPGESTPLTSLFVYSDLDNDIVRFAVKDRDLGGGYLTKNGVKQTETALFDNIPIGEIGQWAFVAGPAGSTSTIGFNAIDFRGKFNASVTSTVTVPASNSAPTVGSAALTAAVTEIADNASGENTAQHTRTGAINFADANPSDSHTVSTSALGSGYRGTLTSAITNSATGDGAGTVAWTYKVNDSALDSLGAGQQVIESFRISLSDGKGGTVSRDVAITLTGSADAASNSAPTVGSAALTAAVTEIADNASGENTAQHTRTGAINFADANLSDSHTVSTSALGSGYRGTLTSAITNSATGDGAGTVAWTYKVNDSALDSLGAGQQVIELFRISLSDGKGGTVSRDVAITLTGSADAASNSAPTVGSAALTAAVTEIADNASGENTAQHTRTGAINFADANLSDSHTVSTSALGSGYRGTLTSAITNSATGDGAGTVAWTYKVNDSALDSLGAGQQVIESFRMSLSDGKGGTVSRDVAITLTGSADATLPSIPLPFANTYSDMYVTQGWEAAAPSHGGQAANAYLNFATDFSRSNGPAGIAALSVGNNGRVYDYRDGILDDGPSTGLGNSGFGNYITIQYQTAKGDYFATYMHLKNGSISEALRADIPSSLSVNLANAKRYADLDVGDTVGKIGDTGAKSYSPHLHFQFSDDVISYVGSAGTLQIADARVENGVSHSYISDNFPYYYSGGAHADIPDDSASAYANFAEYRVDSLNDFWFL